MQCGKEWEAELMDGMSLDGNFTSAREAAKVQHREDPLMERVADGRKWRKKCLSLTGISALPLAVTRTKMPATVTPYSPLDIRAKLLMTGVTHSRKECITG